VSEDVDVSGLSRKGLQYQHPGVRQRGRRTGHGWWAGRLRYLTSTCFDRSASSSPRPVCLLLQLLSTRYYKGHSGRRYVPILVSCYLFRVANAIRAYRNESSIPHLRMSRTANSSYIQHLTIQPPQLNECCYLPVLLYDYSAVRACKQNSY